jgi:hypothetical protein
MAGGAEALQDFELTHALLPESAIRTETDHFREKNITGAKTRHDVEQARRRTTTYLRGL